MAAEWRTHASNLSGQLAASLAGVLQYLSQPEPARRLRLLLMGLLGLWGLAALARLIWAFYPAEEVGLPESFEVVNPAARVEQREAPRSVELKSLQGWHLFGKAAPEPVVDPAAAAEAAEAAQQASGREGIEDGARETRLDLKLRGVVASTDDGLGHAIIEHKKNQAVYAVEDELPVSGKVFLAKVMARQVVLDNGGTYELLRLFEENALDKQLQDLPPPAPRAEARQVRPAARQVDRRDDEAATRLAQSYRQRLYQNPQSLADVVRVTAVREEGELRGYRIGPGREATQFAELGFQEGDLVTGVNGIALDNPANTMRLYQAMRSAGEAVFDLQRDGQQISLSVNLGAQDAKE